MREPETPTAGALALARKLVTSGDVAVRHAPGIGRRVGAPKPKPEHGIGHLDARAQELLHHPCVKLAQTYTSRYVERRGDLILRTYVIRYAHLFAGHPLWHSAGVVLDVENKPKLRADWTRRDRRQMQQMLERRLEHVGEGPVLLGGEARMFEEYALHLLRPLSEAEARHYPADLLTKYEPIDLWAQEADDGGMARGTEAGAGAGEAGGGIPHEHEAEAVS